MEKRIEDISKIVTSVEPICMKSSFVAITLFFTFMVAGKLY